VLGGCSDLEGLSMVLIVDTASWESAGTPNGTGNA